MVLAYHAQLNSVDDQTRIKAAKAWAKWESVLSLSPRLARIDCYSLSHRMITSKLFVDPEHVAEADKDDFAK